MGKQTAGSSQTSVLHPKGSFEWTNVLGVRVSAVNLKSA
ncbi:glycosyltransferase, partial [Rhizobium ruizarguesonis]